MSNVISVVEHAGGELKGATLASITAARQAAAATGGKVLLLVVGDDVDGVAEKAAAYGDVLVAKGAHLSPPTAEAWAPVIAAAAAEHGARVVCATATALGKDVLPRAAALADAGMASEISDFVAVEGDVVRIKRPMWAGNVIGVVEVSGPLAFLTVRATEFDAAEPAGGGAVTELAVAAGEGRTTYVGFDAASTGGRPDPTEAKVVVAGGRGVKSAEHFKMLEQLTDLLDGGIGATRAAVDAGWVPNDWQIGQTGKVVAPDLYFAIGLSGAIQHLAGMKGSKVIVAINKDPEAPIVQVADYGLVADQFQAVPELLEKLKVHQAG